MKLINSKVEILEPSGYTIDDIYRQIEIAGRTCYKSEDKITPTSAKEFVDRMIKSGHGAMLEHGTVYLKYFVDHYCEGMEDKYNSQKEELEKLIERYAYNKYSKVNSARHPGNIFITTNFRVLVENNWLDDLKYACEPTVFHEKRISVRWTCDRGVSHEFVRHRVFSFAQESTRYCNYSKDKFGNELTFIIPCWVDSLAPTREITPERNFIASLQITEQIYLELLNQGWKPQQARSVLPNALKTELVMTGFESDWKHFFELRCDTAAHPDARKLALELYSKLYNKEYEKE